MNKYHLKIESLTKTFGRRLIFKDISFDFGSIGVIGISGPNGSGKSTFVKIIAGLLSPSKGKVIHSLNENQLPIEKLHNHIGFLAPYLVLYDEFSAEENIKFLTRVRGLKFDKNLSDKLFFDFNLYERKNDLLKTYSSGMKQRVKFIFALYHQPELLVFDEPTSTLDNDGKDIVYNVIENEKNNRLIIVASNEDKDLSYCGSILNLNDFKLV